MKTTTETKCPACPCTTMRLLACQVCLRCAGIGRLTVTEPDGYVDERFSGMGSKFTDQDLQMLARTYDGHWQNGLRAVSLEVAGLLTHAWPPTDPEQSFAGI